MKKTRGIVRLIRRVTIGAVAVCGAAMFAAVIRTRLLPASYLAVLGGALALLAGLIVFLIRGGKQVRLCAGVLLAAPYIFMTLSGFTFANRTWKILDDATVSTSPPFTPTAATVPDPTAEPTAVPDPTAEPTAVPEPTTEPAYPDIFTIFVSGIDSREGLVDKSYSDANILFTVNQNTHQVLLVTTPRDSFVPLSISDGARDKLTHSGQFGIDVQMDTMEMLYDMDIDYWFRLDFGGFKNIINALGGVTVHSDYDFTTATGFSYVKGDNEIDGDAALAFARERKSFAAGDLQRGRDQMYLIDAMIQKILSPDMLHNYSEVLDSLEGSFETTIPYGLLAKLVRDQLAGDTEWNIVHYQLTGKDGSEVTYSKPESGKLYVMWLNEDTLETAKDLMARVRDGEIIEQSDIDADLQ